MHFLVAHWNLQVELDTVRHLLDKNGDGNISFSELKSAVASQVIYRIQPGRHYVMLTLAEAESLRVAFHRSTVQSCKSLLPDHPATFAALHSGNIVLDKSQNFVEGSPYQSTIAAACARFLDSQLEFTDAQIAMLLRVLDHSSPEERCAFFLDVKSCRRRRAVPLESSPLQRLISTEDSVDLLFQRVVASQLRSLIHSKGMKLWDAFEVSQCI